jgi:hypothetical protein
VPLDPNSGDGFVAPDESSGLDAPALSDAASNPAAIDHLSVGLTTFTSSNFAEPKRDSWRQEIAHLGGSSPLVRFVDSPRTRIDITAAHPGGLPRFLSGQPTLLEHLFREEFGLRNARLAAAAIEIKVNELRTTRGIDSMQLAIGIASWEFGGEKFCAPILLRPLRIRRVGKDFELSLAGAPALNPQLARLLEEQFHVALDGPSFVSLATVGGTFTPQPVMDRLRGLLSHVSDFTVETRLVASSFADVKDGMLADAIDLAHPVLDALAGNATARAKLYDSRIEVNVVGQDVRPPATDTHLFDADTEQEQVIAEIVAGNSMVVHTLPGTGATQTVLNAVGALVANNKRVLLVGARRARLDDMAHRVRAMGLGGFTLSPRTLRRDVLAAITRNEKARRPDVTAVDDALLRLRKVVLDYRDALGREDAVLGVSVLDALEQLSALALLPEPPATTARLPRRAIEVLATKRREAAASLIQAATLGEFKYGPGDSPWYGVTFETTAEATATHDVAKRLHSVELPRLLERADEVIGQTSMRAFENLVELGIYIRLLGDIRETLDKFVPAVYDRSVADLIAATGSRRGGEMSGAERRQRRKLAQEYIRPGASVSDLHGSLVKIQEQRILWQRYVVSGAVPQVPTGVADLSTAYQRVIDDMRVLDAALQKGNPQPELASLPVSELSRTISGLAAESEVLANLQERTAILAELRDLNLSELLADLSARHVPENLVAQELELAWWQSVLEGMLAGDKALLSANTSILDRLENDFRMVDEAHSSANAALLAAKLAEVWKIALVDFPDEADRLRRVLRDDRLTPELLVSAAPSMAKALGPVWMCSPYEVNRIPAEVTFDTVILLDAGSTTVAENAGAIKRAQQVVAVGDPVTQNPTPFDISTAALDKGGPEAKYSTGIIDPTALMSNKSALTELADILPTSTLTRSYRAGGEDLTDVINRRFYGERIAFMPWAGTFLGYKALNAHHLPTATGVPDVSSGLVETTEAEVAKVVELVLTHAKKRSRESLMVITASIKHAVAIDQALTEELSRNSEFNTWMARDTAEPFTVLTLDQASAESRDRIIFSLGYGRTPHGRLLSEFGSLSRFGGERLLAVAMTRARRSIDLITCFTPEEIELDRLDYGAKALAEILVGADSAPHEEAPGDAEPMLIDLAARLQKRGLKVSLTHGGEIALAVSFGDRAVAIETDAVLSRGSLRESLRLRPALLRRLGWHYLRVHSFELFADPESVAARVVALAGKPDPAPVVVETVEVTATLEYPESMVGPSDDQQ